LGWARSSPGGARAGWTQRAERNPAARLDRAAADRIGCTSRIR
jgi:hypothetical protein